MAAGRACGSYALNHARLRRNVDQVAPAAGVEKPNRFTVGHKKAVVFNEVDGGYPGGAPLKAMDFLPIFNVPYANGTVVAAGNGIPSIRRESYGLDPRQVGQRSPGFFDSAFATAGLSSDGSMVRSGGRCRCAATIAAGVPSNGSLPLRSWQ